MTLVRESGFHFGRWLLHLRREPYSMAFNLVQPVILLIFMGGAFQRAGEWVGTADYRTYLMPGVLALTIFGNSMAGGIPLLFDRESGLLERLLTTPIARASILLGRFLAVHVNTLIQCALLLGLGFLLGVRVVTGVAGVIGLLVIGLALGFGVTVISLVLPFVLENHGNFFAIVGITALPLTFLSSAFVPLDSLPLWMRLFAWINPMTYAIDGMRALVLFGWDGPLIARATVILAAFDGAAFWLGSRILHKQLA
ncbi:MAG TPA: ABC transporter permease [Candidatus Acidoferrales bacterium]|nr:ABC transporter permease [Candidatus Acidoferrales bacterium]